MYVYNNIIIIIIGKKRNAIPFCWLEVVPLVVELSSLI